MQKALITGASGLLGTALVEALKKQSPHLFITAVGREPSHTKLRTLEVHEVAAWPQEGAKWRQLWQSPEWAHSFDTALHLAGESLASFPWTKSKKQRILDSRIKSTQVLHEHLGASPNLKHFFCASGVGIYPDSFNQGQAEDTVLPQAASDGGFLRSVCHKWEQEALKLSAPKRRVVLLRTAAVLSPGGGFLPLMQKLTKWGLGGRIGNGEHFVPWVHIADWVRAVQFILQNPNLVGAVNLSSPAATRQREFATTMARCMQRPLQLPAPAWAVRSLLGDMQELVLSSPNPVPHKLLKAGFEFKFTNLAQVL